jgi:2-oxoglutarate dehydrogenase E1 component
VTASPSEPLLDQLVSDFGGNYVFALDLLEQYRSDRGAVEPSWQQYFDRLLGVAAPPAAVTVAAQPAPPADGPARTATLVRREPPPSGLAEKARALLVPPILPGDIAQPIRGGALRIAENMEASLTVPTATSIRTLPVRTLEENRTLLNKHRATLGTGKISFTHVIAWGIVRALDTFPRLNDAYAELEGGAHRIQRDSVRLGVAVDVQKKDGTRTLLVPNIKEAQKLGFAQFLDAFDDLVARARKGTISPDDFMGTTVSLTNPGTVGTTSSAPRLMPGQGLIVATGALDYPAEYRSMAPRTLSLLGISKVMTVTSTYDHRIIQGAESGLFLARLEELLKGADGFYERIFEDLGVPHRPVKWDIDAAPALFGASSSDEAVEKQAKVPSSSTPTACAGTWWPTSTPSTASAPPTGTSTPPPTASPCGTWTASSSPTTWRARRRRPACARCSTSCARPTAAPWAWSTCTSPTPSARSGCRSAWRAGATAPPSTRPPAGTCWRSWWRRRASSGSCTRSTSATSASRSKAASR